MNGCGTSACYQREQRERSERVWASVRAEGEGSEREVGWSTGRWAGGGCVRCVRVPCAGDGDGLSAAEGDDGGSSAIMLVLSDPTGLLVS
jgi:hypothetical protein